MATTPRIYVACLSSYNAGIHYGKWIDADKDEDDIMEEIQEMLKQSPAPDKEEYEIHGFEGFYDIRMSGEDIETISNVAKNIVKHGEAYAYYIDEIGKIDDDIERFQEAFRGEYKNKIRFGYQMMCDCYSIPEFLHTYIDYEKYARDLLLDYSYVIGETGNIFIYMRL